MSFEKILKNELDSYEQAATDFPWENREAYAQFLAQTFHFVNHSTTLLLLAAANCEMNSKLQSRFNDHAREERGHAKLLTMDLAHMDYDLAKLREMPATSAFYQPQYYWIERVNPCAFFGYVLLLEGVAAQFGPRVYDRIVAAHGKSAAHFVKAHGAEDIEHVEKAIREVSQMDAKTLDVIERNFTQASQSYRLILKTCLEQAGVTAARRAA